MVFRREGAYAMVAVVLVVGAMLLVFASAVWAQGQRRSVSEAQKERIESLSDAEVEEQFVRAAQTSNSSGDLAGERATVNRARNVVIDESNCTVDGDATIVFRDRNDKVIGVANGEGGVTISSNNRHVIVSGSNDISDATNAPLTVLSSTGIDCGDPDNDDGFDDELLLLLLLELLEDNDDGNNGDGDGGDGDNGDGGNGDGDGDNGDDGDGDLDGDGDVDQDDQVLDAENDLNGEATDGELTDGQYDDELGDDGPVSATAEDGQAEASTPGAVARSGGDPDEQAPITDPLGDVEDEIPTSGPLPNTGGLPVATGTVAAMVLLGGGLLAVRLVMIWRGRRA